MRATELRDELARRFPLGISTFELILKGDRTATTRGHALGKPGEYVELYHSERPELGHLIIKVVEVRKVEKVDGQFIQHWSSHEGWSEGYFLKHPELIGMIQTRFKFIDHIRETPA